ncbi:hypothetical protein [Sphaerisporangium perillae]|uniref:hypothetical protein n=1 Tax=Sphaerisporangium perillae TaxID=2935860 RepID=UPI00200F94D2|nr:hypothetical protein [Sphaerisporangium perillae]
MATSDGNKEPPEPAPAFGDEDERLFRLWFESLVLQDKRYLNKGLAVLARMAMADEEFRARLVDDPDGALHGLRERLRLPAGVKLNFFDNTHDSLNLVLPPRAGDVRNRTHALREILRSRTTESDAFLSDDFDFYFNTHSGGGPLDPESADPPIFLGPDEPEFLPPPE